MLFYTGRPSGPSFYFEPDHTPRADFTNLPLLSNQTDAENRLVGDKSFSHTNGLEDTSRTSKPGHSHAEALWSCEGSYTSGIKNYVHICFKY